MILKPIPDGALEVLYKNTESPVIFYFCEIRTYKLPHMTPTDALTIIWSDRSLAIPRENILNWVIRKNSDKYRTKLHRWLTEQHKQGHPEEHDFRCPHCDYTAVSRPLSPTGRMPGEGPSMQLMPPPLAHPGRIFRHLTGDND